MSHDHILTLYGLTKYTEELRQICVRSFRFPEHSQKPSQHDSSQVWDGDHVMSFQDYV